MSSTRRAWVVAASVGVVEALKDQAGFCRWNYAIRSLHQHAKANLGGSSSQGATRFSSASIVDRRRLAEGGEQAKQSEESLKRVMYLSCWGPN